MGLRPLDEAATAWLRSVVAAKPAAYAYVASILEAAGSARVSNVNGTLWGYWSSGVLRSAYWVGGTIVPIEATSESNAALADLLNERGRYSCSIIGDAEAVAEIAAALTWGRPRGVREDQPLLVSAGPPTVEAHPEVRLGTPADERVTFPASVEMFTEEVGFSPIEHGSIGYRARVRSLLASRSTYLVTRTRYDDGSQVRSWPARGESVQVVFKADLGIRSATAVQIQGVWVHPDFRGAGIAARAMVAVTEHVKATVAPIVSLYVNSYNHAALRSYHRAGYRQVGTFATVMY